MESTGDVGDEYTFSPPARDLCLTTRGADRAKARTSVLSRGPLRGAVRIETVLEVPKSATPDRQSRSRDTASIRFAIDVEINQGSPVVSCRLKVDNRASDHRLRVLFPTGAGAVTESRADSAFAVVSRPARRPEPAVPMPEAPVNTAPLQSFVDAGDGKVGMTVLSEGLMEYEVVADGRSDEGARIALTVVRSVGWLSREDLQTRTGNAGPSLETPGAQCLDEYEFRFAFAPRAEPPSESGLCDLGRAFLAPPSVVVGTHGSTSDFLLPGRYSFLSVDCEPPRGIAVSALKKADDRDSVVMRVFNPGQGTVQGQASSGRGITTAFRTNLREQRQEALSVNGGRVAVSIARGKIATLELNV
jgi:alpha-mannosidase